MTVRLELQPEVEAGLLALAQARGLSLEAYVEQVLQERSNTAITPFTGAAEKASAFEAWAHNHPPAPPLPDDALRREHLIRDAR